MRGLYLSNGALQENYVRDAVNFIAEHQQRDGSIPWYAGHSLDVWDHVEAAMGLAIGGEYEHAEKAYRWLADNQLKNGGWWAQYKDGTGCESHCQSNFSAYIAVGVWHYYLVTGDGSFLFSMWPVVARAMDFVLRLQNSNGTIAWAANRYGRPDSRPLLTGCSSICKSLECAGAMASVLGHGEKAADWSAARQRLAVAVLHHPEYFTDIEEKTSRFSMDWFYPILSGVMRGNTAKKRLNRDWNKFVVPGLGCRCVSDQPWVAVAESCELVLSLLATGERQLATTIYNQLHSCWDRDTGGYWTGFQYEIDEFWPVEQTTWTSAAVLLAADALSGYTSACELFLKPQPAEEPELKKIYDVGSGG